MTKEQTTEKKKQAPIMKMLAGVGITIGFLHYARRIADIVALSIFIYAVTSLLSPFYKWAAYVHEHIGLLVFAIVTGMFLLASLIGKKKVKAGGVKAVPLDEHGTPIRLEDEKKLWQVIKESPLTITSILLIIVIFIGLFLVNTVSFPKMISCEAGMEGKVTQGNDKRSVIVIREAEDENKFWVKFNKPENHQETTDNYLVEHSNIKCYAKEE